MSQLWFGILIGGAELFFNRMCIHEKTPFAKKNMFCQAKKNPKIFMANSFLADFGSIIMSCKMEWNNKKVWVKFVKLEFLLQE